MILEIEGQEISIDDSIAISDDLIKQALSPFFPEMANANLDRSQPGRVKVIKRAGTNGIALSELFSAMEADDRPGVLPNAALQSLIKAREWVNPAIQMAVTLKRLEATGAIDLRFCVQHHAEIERAKHQGETCGKQVDTALHLLKDATDEPSEFPIFGV